MSDTPSGMNISDKDQALLEVLEKRTISCFDLLPHDDIREKLVDLVLHGSPSGITKEAATLFGELRERLISTRVDDAKVVVFGGGTGLSR